MSSIADSIIDICARAESQYGFKIVHLAISQGAFNKLRVETDWVKPLVIRNDGAVLFNDVVIEVERA